MWKFLPWAATAKMVATKARVILPTNKKNRLLAIKKMKDPRKKHLAELKVLEREAAKEEKRSKKRQEEIGLMNYRLSAPFIYEHGNAPTSNPRSSSSQGREATRNKSSSSTGDVANKMVLAFKGSLSKSEGTHKKTPAFKSSSSKSDAHTKEPSAKSASSKNQSSKAEATNQKGRYLHSATTSRTPKSEPRTKRHRSQKEERLMSEGSDHTIRYAGSRSQSNEKKDPRVRTYSMSSASPSESP